jgi:anaerobic magnesium-protoporphyrin IX monomethyl ester cyclase
MQPLKILFVNAINPFVEAQNRYPALGIGYLIAMLRQQLGKMVDCQLVESGVEETIRSYGPDLLAISSVSQNFHIAQRYAKLGKDAGLPVIIGGYHITELPSNQNRDMDVAVLGEGEYTICDLVILFLEHGSFPVSKLQQLSGIAYWDGDTQVITAPREVVGKVSKSLDELPMPARDLMKIRPHANMLTSRGCPYTCEFCASTRFWPNIRYFSPEYMIEEVKKLIKDHGVRYITFHDDLFIANVKRLRGFHELVLREGLPQKGFKFSCSSSATRITDEMGTLLKEMNFVSVAMGLESGNQEVLTRLKTPAFKVETNREAIRILRKHGIHVHASFIIGERHETLEQMGETYQFIRDNPISLVNLYVLTPLPGTPVWYDAKARGLVSDDMDWNRLNISFEIGWREAILVSEAVNREQLHAMYQKIRRLRFFKFARAVAGDPLKMDLLAYGKAKVVEWAHRARILRVA